MDIGLQKSCREPIHAMNKSLSRPVTKVGPSYISQSHVAGLLLRLLFNADTLAGVMGKSTLNAAGPYQSDTGICIGV